MEEGFRVSVFELVMGVSQAADLICPEVGRHQMQVAYSAVRISEKLVLSEEQKNELIYAGLLHDIGATSLKEKLNCLTFEEVESMYHHAEVGYSFLRTFPPLSDVANIVRFHHVPWNKGRGSHFEGQQVPMGSPSFILPTGLQYF